MLTLLKFVETFHKIFEKTLNIQIFERLTQIFFNENTITVFTDASYSVGNANFVCTGTNSFRNSD